MRCLTLLVTFSSVGCLLMQIYDRLPRRSKVRLHSHSRIGWIPLYIVNRRQFPNPVDDFAIDVTLIHRTATFRS